MLKEPLVLLLPPFIRVCVCCDPRTSKICSNFIQSGVHHSSNKGDGGVPLDAVYYNKVAQYRNMDSAVVTVWEEAS
jgi:hypothetical protein